MLLVDWHSYKILFHEWYQLYHHSDHALPPLHLSFRDYVLAEKRLETTALYQQAQAYWLNRLETLPPGPDLPLA
jgi:pyochelin synthetase